MNMTPITQISKKFISSGNLEFNDLEEIVIPAILPLEVDLYFNRKGYSSGVMLSIHVNGKMACKIQFQNESGLKSERADITNLLRRGRNEIRVRCLVTCKPLENIGDEALFWLRRYEETIIRKKFFTKNTIEPFDQIWNLWIHDEQII